MGKDKEKLFDGEERFKKETNIYQLYTYVYTHYICNRIIHTGSSLNIVFFFPRILESLSTPPRQHSAAIGCTKNYQPIGVAVHSHCVRALKVSYSDVGKGGFAENCEKTPCISHIPCRFE